LWSVLDALALCTYGLIFGTVGGSELPLRPNLINTFVPL